jgi:hypothetical protein
MFAGHEKRFNKIEDYLQNLKVELSGDKDSVNGLKADLSDTPSRREFLRMML